MPTWMTSVMTTEKKTPEGTKSWWWCRSRPVGVQAGTTTSENSLMIFTELEHHPVVPLLGTYPTDVCIGAPKIYYKTYLVTPFINSPKLKTSRMPISNGIDT